MSGIDSLRRPPFFFGEHDLLIDDKNRLLIPAQIRKNIDPDSHGKSLFVILKRYENGFIPWFYPEVFYMHLVIKQDPTRLTPSTEQLEHTHRTLSMADRLEWDSQGRIVLPAKILSRAELGTVVTLIGAKEHLELWNRAKWTAYQETLISKSDEIDGWAQKSLGQPNSGQTDSGQPKSENKPAT
ncbi:MAG: hypothetical protein ABSC42_11300 [Tepidisphaeraceae bacterium]|jgi:MraZ protein